MTSQGWFQLQSTEGSLCTERVQPPQLICGCKLSVREIEKADLNTAELNMGGFKNQLSLHELSTSKKPWLPKMIGHITESKGALLFTPWKFKLELDFQISHIREGEESVIDEESVELWSSDILRFTKKKRSLDIRILSQDLDLNDVILERSIADVSEFADRVFTSQDRITKLFQHSVYLGQSSDLDQTLKTSTQFIFDLLPRATHTAIALKEECGKRFPVVYAAHRSGDEVELPMSRTLMKHVVEHKTALLLMNASEEMGGAMSVLAAGLISTLCVPLWIGAEICGVLQIDNRDTPGVFSATDLELLTVAASTISFAAESARLIQRLRVAEDQLKGGLDYMQNQDRQEAIGMIGESEKMALVFRNIERVQDLKVPVFINGETGTGKELVARALHYNSARRNKLFVAQNCGALPESILESELFGHCKGSFTGADRDKKGLFELADKGSVFLDEIGEMPPSLQTKLLRVLQEGEIWPLGLGRPKKVDVRIISATHRDLNEMVKEGTFRQDLFYRLHVYPIHLPPLRDREGDIGLIAKHFLKKYSQEFGRGVSGFSEGVIRYLTHYQWPGNVRELQNEIQRALISRFEGDLILEEDLSPHISGIDPSSPDIMLEVLSVQGTLKEMMEHLEKRLISRALKEHNHNKTHTARALGITREGLHKKLVRFQM